MKCHCLKVDLFILADPLKPFAPENRKILRQVSFGTIDDEEVKYYRNSSKMIEPLFPYRWWKDNLTYYEIKYGHFDEYQQLVDESDEIRRFKNTNNFDPLKALNDIQTF